MYSIWYCCPLCAAIWPLTEGNSTRCCTYTIELPDQWRTERGGLGCSNPPRNSEDIGGVHDHISKKNRRLDFHLQFTVFSYGFNLLNKGFF